MTAVLSCNYDARQIRCDNYLQEILFLTQNKEQKGFVLRLTGLGEEPTDSDFAMKVLDLNNLDETLGSIKSLLQSKGIIFKP